MRKITLIVILGIAGIILIPVLLPTYIHPGRDIIVPSTEAIIAFGTLLLVLATAFRFLLNVERDIMTNLIQIFFSLSSA
jgi:hypothetical protein